MFAKTIALGVLLFLLFTSHSKIKSTPLHVYSSSDELQDTFLSLYNTLLSNSRDTISRYICCLNPEKGENTYLPALLILASLLLSLILGISVTR